MAVAKPAPVLDRSEQQPLFSLVPKPIGNTISFDGITLYHADVLSLYSNWSSPTVIVSDGAYGLGLFPGDPKDATGLTNWYLPHIQAWSEKATPQTTLWFWNTELGWATVHPLLAAYGWKYVSCHIWDKGIAHVAGNTNTKTLRKFPVVTEVCVQYVRETRIGGLTLRDWLRQEWLRTGLPLYRANEACGVKNAATRKYLTNDHLWYFPPPEAFGQMVDYANRLGNPEGKPYFSNNGETSLTVEEWALYRSKFYCKHGITNVWREPPLNGDERVKAGNRSLHINQKPLKLMEMIIEASSDAGDYVWEPFGGLCTAAVAAHRLQRRCLSAEKEKKFFDMAVTRLTDLAW